MRVAGAQSEIAVGSLVIEAAELKAVDLQTRKPGVVAEIATVNGALVLCEEATLVGLVEVPEFVRRDRCMLMTKPLVERLLVMMYQSQQVDLACWYNSSGGVRERELAAGHVP